MNRCGQELCPNWTGQGCACEVFDIHHTYGCWCADSHAEPAELHQHRFLGEDPLTVSCACGERGQLIDGGCATNPEPAEETP